MPKAKRSRPIVAAPKAAAVPKAAGANAGGASGQKQKRKLSGKEHEHGASSSKGQSSGAGGKQAGGGQESGKHYGGQKPSNMGAQRGQGGGYGHGGDHDGPRQLQCMSMVDRQAASIVGRLLDADARRTKGTSLKTLVFAPHIEAKKATFAVTCEVLKSVPLLEQLYDSLSLAESAPKVSRYTAYVLMYEVLKGEGLRQKGPAERHLLGQQEWLQEGVARLHKKHHTQDWEALLTAVSGGERAASGRDASVSGAAPSSGGGGMKPHPRWARVNLLKAPSVQHVVQLFAQPPKEWPEKYRSGSTGGTTKAGAVPQPVVDDLLPDLLRFPPGTDLHDHPLVAQGWVVLQSKASCMPARALMPHPDWHVVDCCAAPGNKTTHLASVMKGGSGKVYAFDKDPRRLARLQANAKGAGAERIITATCADFLSIDPTSAQYAQVRGVLLDPSCSGSGTVFTRMDHLLPSFRQKAAAGGAGAGSGAGSGSGAGAGGEEEGGGEDGPDSERVKQLAKFQVAALRHALRFPALQRLVYSTCSVHTTENEDVVQTVLQEAQEAGFELADPFPAWPRRGLLRYSGCEKLVRCDAYEDETDGFFVAVFQRSAQAQGQVEGQGDDEEVDEGAAEGEGAGAAARSSGGMGGSEAVRKQKKKRKVKA